MELAPCGRKAWTTRDVDGGAGSRRTGRGGHAGTHAAGLQRGGDAASPLRVQRDACCEQALIACVCRSGGAQCICIWFRYRSHRTTTSSSPAQHRSLSTEKHRAQSAERSCSCPSVTVVVFSVDLHGQALACDA